MSDLIFRLKASAEDPMWAAHAEISKSTLREAIAALAQQEAPVAAPSDHVPVPRDVAEQIDAALELVELPPIRVSVKWAGKLRGDAERKGLILQAHVRELLEAEFCAAQTAEVVLPQPIAELRRIRLTSENWTKWATFDDEYWGPSEVQEEKVFTADQLREAVLLDRARGAAKPDSDDSLTVAYLVGVKDERDRAGRGVPEGWSIARDNRDKLFRSIDIKAPNGFMARVSSVGRNPENVLYMLAEALLAAAPQPNTKG